MSESGELTERAEQTGRKLPSGAHLVFQAGLFALCFLLLYSRRPDANSERPVLAEDGAVWYRDAYQLGWRCLLIPEKRLPVDGLPADRAVCAVVSFPPWRPW